MSMFSMNFEGCIITVLVWMGGGGYIRIAPVSPVYFQVAAAQAIPVFYKEYYMDSNGGPMIDKQGNCS